MRLGRARSLTIALMLLLGASAPVLASPGIACAAAASGGPHAALLVDTGQRATVYCVGLDQASVSGMHLIELASDQYGLRYRLGFGGRAVCMLAGVGATGDDCFGNYPNFWGYFHGTGASGWTWATGSAADHQVSDGDREAWSWGTGDSGTTHTAPPPTAIDDACGPATPDPSPTPQPTPTPSPPPSLSPSSGAVGGPSDDGGGGPSSEHTHSPRPPASTSPTAAAATSPSPNVVRAAAASPPASGGPPAGGLVTIAAIACLGAGGWLMARRRRAQG